MKTSDNGVDKIKKEEGLKLKAYKCSSGVPTIGYGHTKDVSMGQTITHQKAEEFLREDLKACEKAVNDINNKKGYNLNQNQFDSLVSFTYNCGIGNLRKLTNNRTKNEIPEGIKLYNKGKGGKEVRGLTNRRKRESDLFTKPIENSSNNNLNLNNSNQKDNLTINPPQNIRTNYSFQRYDSDIRPTIIRRETNVNRIIRPTIIRSETNIDSSMIRPTIIRNGTNIDRPIIRPIFNINDDEFSFGFMCSIF